MAAGGQWAAQLRWPGQLVSLLLGFIPLWQSQNPIRASPEHEDSPDLSLMTCLLMSYWPKPLKPRICVERDYIQRYGNQKGKIGKFSEGLAVNALPCPFPGLLGHFSFSHCLLRTFLCSFSPGIMILCYLMDTIFNYNISRLWECFILF